MGHLQDDESRQKFFLGRRLPSGKLHHEVQIVSPRNEFSQSFKGRGNATPSFRIPDGDTTSACCRILLQADYPVDPLILAQFEDREKHIFRTYHYERNPSISTNIHALDALQLLPDYPNHDEVKEQIILMLLERRMYKMYWVDKWHASPYYATAHALLALLQEGEYLANTCSLTVDWILHTQKEDGSWGFFEQGTVEETVSYCTDILETMKPGGGYCFAPTHMLQDNSPVENVVAMYETVREKGAYTD